jgi:hypothetical protein
MAVVLWQTEGRRGSKSPNLSTALKVELHVVACGYVPTEAARRRASRARRAPRFRERASSVACRLGDSGSRQEGYWVTKLTRIEERPLVSLDALPQPSAEERLENLARELV